MVDRSPLSGRRARIPATLGDTVNRFERALVRVASDFASLDLTWALVGGLAVSVWAEPRLTRDIDVAIAASSDRDAESVVRRLGGLGWHVVELVEQEAIGTMATARLACLADDLDGIILDLLFASAGIESEVARSAALVEVLPGVTLPVASRAHLIAMKLLARDDRSRPQDADDLRALIRGATPDEIVATREALELITRRGFNRRRALTTMLDRELESSR